MAPFWASKLETHEGRRLVVYDDATGLPLKPGVTLKGHPTIGIGRALDVNGLTPAECDTLFSDDVTTCEQKLLLAFPHFLQLSEGRRFVLVEVAFNCGWAGLLGFPVMLAALWAGQWDRAAVELLASKAARELPGRYAELATVLRTGTAPGAPA